MTSSCFSVLRFNIHFRSKHIPGKLSETADIIFHRIFRKTPHLYRQQTKIQVDLRYIWQTLQKRPLVTLTRRAYIQQWQIFLVWACSISLRIHLVLDFWRNFVRGLVKKYEDFRHTYVVYYFVYILPGGRKICSDVLN